jgi:DNA-directed RNA polymerase specialized sigma24 family protein
MTASMNHDRTDPSVALAHRDLIRGMRRDNADAFREFFRRFRPLLLAEARRLHIQPALCHEVVDECLDDVAMQLRRPTTRVPSALAPYLIRALRLRQLKLRRSERRRSHREGNDPDKGASSRKKSKS